MLAGEVFRERLLTECSNSTPVVRELGDRRWEARAIRQLAIVHRNDGDTKTAITMLAECMSIFGELEDRRGMAVVFRNRGDAWRLAGDLTRQAVTCLARSRPSRPSATGAGPPART